MLCLLLDMNNNPLYTKSYYMELIGKLIRKVRVDQGKSQETVAYDSDINPAYYGQIERGLKCPTVYTLYRIAYALDIPPSKLILLDQEAAIGYIKNKDSDDMIIKGIPANRFDEISHIVRKIIDLAR